jgi:HAD superfamily hydrolase (TIGR01509 family)
MPLKCIIFDMDGTLTETNRLIFDSFNHIAERYQDRRYDEAEIVKMFGPPEETALLSIVGTDQIDEAMVDYLDFYRSHHKRLARLHPGMKEILAFLDKAGCIVALFTGKGTHTTRISLEELGIKEYFDYTVTGNDVVNHKPSSEGILKILDHFQLKPDEALMIGDAVSDVKAAHGAGVKMAAVLWDSYAREKMLALQTDYAFHTVAELEQWLRINLG